MPTTSDLFCVQCRKFMRPHHNRVVVEEKRGNDLPYKLWLADEWRCPQCGHSVVSGFAAFPFAEHFQEHYGRARYRALQEKTFYEENL